MAVVEQNIPRKGLPEPSYQVHRPSNSISGPSNYQESSFQNKHHERSLTPPPYSGPVSPAPAPQSPNPQIYYSGLPKLDYRLYSPPSFKLSSDQTTITSYDPQLSTQRTALLTLIRQLAAVPPKPQIRIVGNDNSGNDFDIKINIMSLIFPDGREQRMDYIKTIPSGELGYRGKTKETTSPDMEGLEEWVRAYCEDDCPIKYFTLERAVINWDTSYLEGRILSLLSSISYRGHVIITFPTTHTKVKIHAPDKMNRFISNMTKVFTGTRKYELVKSIWPYANVPRGEPGRRCVIQDEDTWFDDWKDAIANAALVKRKGWLTIEDRLEFLMEPKSVVQKGAVQIPGGWGTSSWGLSDE